MTQALQSEYEIGDEIGRGRFGTVYRCYHRVTGDLFALKTTNKSLLADAADGLDLELAEQEPKLHLLVSSSPSSSRHVVGLHAAFEDADSIHLVLDYCPRGDLLTLLSSKAPLAESEAAVLMSQLMEAILTCHERGVAHRDIKPDNVLFDSDGHLRLADFGSAGWFGDGRLMTGLVGTPFYVAPEIIRGREYGEKVDVWSAGVVLYMMLSGMPPFYGDSAAEIFEAVRMGSLRFPTRVWGSVSPAAKDLIRRMVCRDVSRRFSAEQVMAHPWIVSCGGAASLI